MTEFLWDYIENRLFFKKTAMLYDCIFDETTPMPTPEEIKFGIPNPNGCGTMTEDAMITGGTALQGLCLYAKRTHKRQEFAHKVAAGMLCCAGSGKDGFLPRSIQPIDGISHYHDTSRDQITLFLYGILLYAQSGLCDVTLTKRAQQCVANIRGRADKNITPENGYNFLTEDGKFSENGVFTPYNRWQSPVI